MGLIECPDCDGKVSEAAPTCPHCGRPMGVGVSLPPPAVAVSDEECAETIREYAAQEKEDWMFAVGAILIPCLLVFGLVKCADLMPKRETFKEFEERTKYK